jgi:aryl-alcohol dehydrogenase-like predicted oxidoreductase
MMKLKNILRGTSKTLTPNPRVARHFCWSEQPPKDFKPEPDVLGSRQVPPELDPILDDHPPVYNLSTFYKRKGFATSEGTLKYKQNAIQSQQVHFSHFRKPFKDDLHLSSTGIGTYLGSPLNSEDEKVLNAIIKSVKTGGFNVIDTAINYRYQKAERVIGEALRILDHDHNITRDQLFVASKVGYVPEDADRGINLETYIQGLIKQGVIKEKDIVGEVHCMTPGYLSHQIDESLRNLQLETLDLMYLHNASESQLPLVGEEAFYEKLARAFETFETAISDGRIRAYGMATWVSLRSPPEETGIHTSIMKILEVAEKVAGKNHGLKYVQVPLNLMMVEAMGEKWQPVDSELHYQDRKAAMEASGAGF